MPKISHRTYERLGTGVRYFNLHLGHHADNLDALPALNPFKGIAVEDIDDELLSTLESRLVTAVDRLNESDCESLAASLNVSQKNIRLAREGAETALDAVTDARTELGE